MTIVKVSNIVKKMGADVLSTTKTLREKFIIVNINDKVNVKNIVSRLNQTGYNVIHQAGDTYKIQDTYNSGIK